MHAKLVIVGGKANKGEVALDLPGTIGRSRDADLTVAHPMISRQHCELYEVDGLLMIRDLGSLNGTFVGQAQIKEAPLRPNDQFSIGPLTFRVEYDYIGETPVAPAETPAAEAVPEIPDFEAVGPEVPIEQRSEAPAAEETLSVDPPEFDTPSLPRRSGAVGGPAGRNCPYRRRTARLRRLGHGRFGMGGTTGIAPDSRARHRRTARRGRRRG